MEDVKKEKELFDEVRVLEACNFIIDYIVKNRSEIMTDDLIDIRFDLISEYTKQLAPLIISKFTDMQKVFSIVHTSKLQTWFTVRLCEVKN